MLDISGESSAWQRIHMKHQALFSLKVKIIKVLSAAILLGTLAVKTLLQLTGTLLHTAQILICIL